MVLNPLSNRRNRGLFGLGRNSPAPVTPDKVAEQRAAFAKIAKQYEADLLRAARRMHRGDDDRAADLVQDTLVRGYEAYLQDRFTDGSNARAWLLRILTNSYINDYRRRQKWESPVDYETLTANGESGPNIAQAADADVPGKTLLSATMDERIERALNSLSDGLRLCVLLVDVEELDYVQAAQILHIPVGTVRSRLSRARMQLHAALLEYAKEKRVV